MKFSEMVAEFRATLPGTESFKRARRNCLGIITSHPDQAAAAFLIAGFCRSYVVLYEEEALDLDFAKRNHSLILEYMLILDEALSAHDVIKVHDALNKVVSEYSVGDGAF
jgi:hypothetical protein